MYKIYRPLPWKDAFPSQAYTHTTHSYLWHSASISANSSYWEERGRGRSGLESHGSSSDSSARSSGIVSSPGELEGLCGRMTGSGATSIQELRFLITTAISFPWPIWLVMMYLDEVWSWG
ncbi:hypothetical protein NL676_002838 [Syzygium grande]|nr:hypothetical protein NL676_002838 [Syzygium grande]